MSRPVNHIVLQMSVFGNITKYFMKENHLTLNDARDLNCGHKAIVKNIDTDIQRNKV
jgi:hypothetical protein